MEISRVIVNEPECLKRSCGDKEKEVSELLIATVFPLIEASFLELETLELPGL